MKISRRTFLLAFPAPLVAQRRPAAARPNVVLVVASDAAARMLGCYGNPAVQTPNLDLLARMGTRFTNSCAAAPSPLANRATLLSGRLPRQHGVRDSGPGDSPNTVFLPASFERELLLSDLLAAAGYRCGYVGQWGLGAGPRPGHGFESASILIEGASSPDFLVNGERIRQEGYLTDQITSHALSFLSRQEPGKPFFLTVSYPGAEPPYDATPQKFRDLYARAEFRNLAYAPAAPNAAAGREFLADTLSSIRAYAAALSALDAEIPRLQEALRSRKLWDNTLFIFTALRGNLLGFRGLWGDGRASAPVNLYEHALQTPLIWSWPGRVPVDGFRPELVSSYDLVPSVCEAAGVNLPPGLRLCGLSYAPLAFGRGGDPRRPWRTRLFAELHNAEMARDSRYKLVVRDGGSGPCELYDLRADPGELNNEYDNPGFSGVRRRLTADLEQWRKGCA